MSNKQNFNFFSEYNRNNFNNFLSKEEKNKFYNLKYKNILTNLQKNNISLSIDFNFSIIFYYIFSFLLIVFNLYCFFSNICIYRKVILSFSSIIFHYLILEVFIYVFSKKIINLQNIKTKTQFNLLNHSVLLKNHLKKIKYFLYNIAISIIVIGFIYIISKYVDFSNLYSRVLNINIRTYELKNLNISTLELFTFIFFIGLILLFLFYFSLRIRVLFILMQDICKNFNIYFANKLSAIFLNFIQIFICFLILVRAFQPDVFRNNLLNKIFIIYLIKFLIISRLVNAIFTKNADIMNDFVNKQNNKKKKYFQIVNKELDIFYNNVDNLGDIIGDNLGGIYIIFMLIFTLIIKLDINLNIFYFFSERLILFLKQYIVILIFLTIAILYLLVIISKIIKKYFIKNDYLEQKYETKSSAILHKNIVALLSLIFLFILFKGLGVYKLSILKNKFIYVFILIISILIFLAILAITIKNNISIKFFNKKRLSSYGDLNNNINNNEKFFKEYNNLRIASLIFSIIVLVLLIILNIIKIEILNNDIIMENQIITDGTIRFDIIHDSLKELNANNDRIDNLNDLSVIFNDLQKDSYGIYENGQSLITKNKFKLPNKTSIAYSSDKKYKLFDSNTQINKVIDLKKLNKMNDSVKINLYIIYFYNYCKKYCLYLYILIILSSLIQFYALIDSSETIFGKLFYFKHRKFFIEQIKNNIKLRTEDNFFQKSDNLYYIDLLIQGKIFNSHFNNNKEIFFDELFKTIIDDQSDKLIYEDRFIIQFINLFHKKIIINNYEKYKTNQNFFNIIDNFGNLSAILMKFFISLILLKFYLSISIINSNLENIFLNYKHLIFIFLLVTLIFLSIRIFYIIIFKLLNYFHLKNDKFISKKIKFFILNNNFIQYLKDNNNSSKEILNLGVYNQLFLTNQLFISKKK